MKGKTMKKLISAALIAAVLICAFTACTVIGNDGPSAAPTNSGAKSEPRETDQTAGPEKPDDSYVGKLCFIHEFKGFAPEGIRLNGDKVEKSNDMPFSATAIRGDFLPGECITVFMEGNFAEGIFENSFAILVPHSAPDSYKGANVDSVSAVKLAESSLETPNEEHRIGSLTVPAEAQPGVYDLLISCKSRIACCVVINISDE